jgi:cysteine desulfuration protein SufE
MIGPFTPALAILLPSLKVRHKPPSERRFRVCRGRLHDPWPEPLTQTFDTLTEDFALLDDWEERYKYLIELGKQLPEMPNELKSPATKVSGCASQVWIFAQDVDGKLVLQGDSDALIVKGLVAVATMIFGGQKLRDVAAIDAAAMFERLGLKEHLTPQRSNGLASMVKRIKVDAARLSEG